VFILNDFKAQLKFAAPVLSYVENSCSCATSCFFLPSMSLLILLL